MIQTRMRTCLAALLAGALMPALAADRSEERAPGAFTAVALSAPIEVEIALGERDSVVLEGDADDLARVVTVVEDGTLRIGMKERKRWNSAPKVRGRVIARRIDAVKVAGSGRLSAPRIEGESLQVSIAGSGDVRVGGKVGQLDGTIAGSGELRAERLDARRVKVSVAGSGDALVWARESLSVRVAGSGDVGFYGDATVTRFIAGSGSVRRLGDAPS
jgi:hypothetical protein